MLTTGSSLAREENDLRVDLLTFLRRHILEREIPLYDPVIMCPKATNQKRTYVNHTHDVQGLTLCVDLGELKP